MRFKLPMFVLVCVPLAAQQPVSQVAFSESQEVVPAFSASGSITLPAVHLHLDISYPAGKKELGDLVVVFDPGSGHYLWQYTPLRSPNDITSFLTGMKSGGEAIYAGPDELVDFTFPGLMSAKAYSERAGSLSAAERASIDEIRRGLAVFERNGYHTDYKLLSDVAKAIPRGFACAPYGSPEFKGMCPTTPQSIVSISQQDGNWRLILRARWDQELILDSKFNFVSTKQLTLPSKE